VEMIVHGSSQSYAGAVSAQGNGSHEHRGILRDPGGPLRAVSASQPARRPACGAHVELAVDVLDVDLDRAKRDE
jgi:hypothetical protein